MSKWMSEAMRTSSFMHNYINSSSKIQIDRGSEILGGISDAQWLAFTIEEEFSNKCILPPPLSTNVPFKCPVASDDVNDPNLADISASEEKINLKSMKQAVFDTEKVLDKELLRIFINYEADKTPGQRSMSNNEHFDFCKALIGMSLNTGQELSLSGKSRTKENQDTSKKEIGKDKVDLLIQESPECTEESSGSEIADSDSDCSSCENDGGNHEDVTKTNDTEQPKVENQGESWPLLKTIMQLDKEDKMEYPKERKGMGHGIPLSRPHSRSSI